MKKINDIFVLALAASVVSGCGMLAVGPDFKSPEISIDDSALKAPEAGWPVTTNLTETGEFKLASDLEDPRSELKAEEIITWWRQFNDELLSDLVENAVSNNRTFLMAQQRLEQARWRYAGSWADLMPKITGVGSYSRAHSSENESAGKNAVTRRDTFKTGFDATWEIDIFGGVRRGIEEADARMAKAHCDLADAWVSLSSEIGSQYIALRTVQERLRVARANLVLQTETYDILQSRLQSGIGDELAVNQAKYNVEQTRASIPNLLSQEEAHMNALAVLAGTMPGALHSQLKNPIERDWLVEPKKLSAIPLDVMRKRPDVRSAEHALAAQVAHVGVAASMLYPKFFINGSLGLESIKMQKFLDRGSLYGSLGPTLSWPIFQGGNLVANLRMEEAAMEEVALNYEFTIQTAFQEVRSAYSAYTQEYHRYESLKNAVKAAKDAETISQDLYKNGLSDFNNVLDAQRSLLSLEEALTISRGQISQDLISLYKALGGGVSM
ncbi:MAG: efflux transporter outer membrane subunit [Kiritimatiellae bacterium]|nr:efflux transporter outer membrane subunit [Kiritimatiellia bacterium]